MMRVVTAGEIVVGSRAPAICIDQFGRLGRPCRMISSDGADAFGTTHLEGVLCVHDRAAHSNREPRT